MARDKTRDLRKMNRRNFLSKLSAMGISGATLQYMTKDAMSMEDIEFSLNVVV